MVLDRRGDWAVPLVGAVQFFQSGRRLVFEENIVSKDVYKNRFQYCLRGVYLYALGRAK